MKRLFLIFFALLMCVVSFAADAVSIEHFAPEFLTGFASFTGLVTAVVGVLVTLFSWWMNLGFPPSDASIWVVLIDALFVALASTGIVSVVTSEWLAKLFGKKVTE